MFLKYCVQKNVTKRQHNVSSTLNCKQNGSSEAESHYCLQSSHMSVMKQDTRACTFLCSRADGATCWLALGNNGDLDLGSLGGFAWRGTWRLPPLAMGPQFISVQALHLITGHWHCTHQPTHPCKQTNKQTNTHEHRNSVDYWGDLTGVLSLCNPITIFLSNCKSN